MRNDIIEILYKKWRLDMSGIINIILGAVVLFVVVVLFLWVSSKHKESDLEIPVAAIVLRAVPIVQLVLKIRSKKENKYD